MVMFGWWYLSWWFWSLSFVVCELFVTINLYGTVPCPNKDI